MAAPPPAACVSFSVVIVQFDVAGTGVADPAHMNGSIFPRRQRRLRKKYRLSNALESEFRTVKSGGPTAPGWSPTQTVMKSRTGSVRCSGLVKVAGVAPPELQNLGSVSQPQYMPPNLSRPGLIAQTAPASFRRFLLLVIYVSFLFIYILQLGVFHNSNHNF